MSTEPLVDGTLAVDSSREAERSACPPLGGRALPFSGLAAIGSLTFQFRPLMDAIGSSPSRHKPPYPQGTRPLPLQGRAPLGRAGRSGVGASACKESACLEGRVPALMGEVYAVCALLGGSSVRGRGPQTLWGKGFGGLYAVYAMSEGRERAWGAS